MMRLQSIILGIAIILGMQLHATIQELALFNQAHGAILVCFAKHPCNPRWKHTIEPNSEKKLFSADLKYREGEPLYLNVAYNGHVLRFTIHYNHATHLVTIMRGNAVISEMDYNADSHRISIEFTENEEALLVPLLKHHTECEQRCRFDATTSRKQSAKRHRSHHDNQGCSFRPRCHC